MAVLNIHTRLDDFLMVDQINLINDKNISGSNTFLNAPFSFCLESLVQMCALHVRYTLNFEKHVFLLKINRCAINTEHTFSGRYALHAELMHRSSQAFSYTAAALRDEIQIMDGSFIIAAREYDKNFMKKNISPHYKKVFSCLLNTTRTN
ncbi:MAG: hypothetical protein MI799_19440 [Desulfobacterales bacterium]|nr:hypothetical protein [Desulfobacterales bacterium]